MIEMIHSVSHTDTVFTSAPHSSSTVWNWIFNLMLWSVLWLSMDGCFKHIALGKVTDPNCHQVGCVLSQLFAVLTYLSAPVSVKHSLCHLFSSSAPPCTSGAFLWGKSYSPLLDPSVPLSCWTNITFVVCLLFTGQVSVNRRLRGRNVQENMKYLLWIT